MGHTRLAADANDHSLAQGDFPALFKVLHNVSRHLLHPAFTADHSLHPCPFGLLSDALRYLVGLPIIFKQGVDFFIQDCRLFFV